MIIALKVFANMKMNAGPLKAEHLGIRPGRPRGLLHLPQAGHRDHLMMFGLWIGLIVAVVLAFGTFLA